MPIYQYVCVGCQSEFELRRPRIDAAKKAPCPQCGSEAKRRITEFSAKKKG